MPQPYPGQEWKHGWVPLTASAARSKNHGRRPGGGSLISRMVAEAAAAHKKQQTGDTGRQGKVELRDASTGTSSAAPNPAKSASKPAAKAPAKPTSRSASVPKPGNKVGVDSTGKPVRVGDEVRLTGGEGYGKDVRVISKGRAGRIRVRAGDGREIDAFTENVRNRADYETSRKADASIRRAAGRVASNTTNRPTPSIGEIQNRARDAYNKLAREPGDWVKLARLRDRMGKDLPRAGVDEALRRMAIAPGANVAIAPEADQKTLTDADRAAAVEIGGRKKHMIAIWGA